DNTKVIDRQTLLGDILECEALFQRAKRKMVELYMESYDCSDERGIISSGKDSQTSKRQNRNSGFSAQSFVNNINYLSNLNNPNNNTIIPLPKSSGFIHLIESEPSYYGFTRVMHNIPERLNTKESEETNPNLTETQMEQFFELSDRNDRIILTGRTNPGDEQIVEVKQILKRGSRRYQKQHQQQETKRIATRISAEQIIIRDCRGVKIIYERALAMMEQLEDELLRIVSYFLIELLEARLDVIVAQRRNQIRMQEFQPTLNRPTTSTSKDLMFPSQTNTPNIQNKRSGTKSPNLTKVNQQLPTKQQVNDANQQQTTYANVIMQQDNTKVIDRQTLLGDILECEALFQRAKRKMVELYMESYDCSD
ncbi:MAG: hypothetical protein EZS28_049699, partial [Streblomastix strix]